MIELVCFSLARVRQNRLSVRERPLKFTNTRLCLKCKCGLLILGRTIVVSFKVRQEETSKSTSPETIYPIYARKYGYDKGGELRELELLWRAATGQNQTKEILKNMTVLAMLFNPEEQERDAGFADEIANDSPELLSDTAKQEFHSKPKSVLKKSNGTVNLVPENEEEDVNEMVEDVATTEGDSSTEVTTILGHTSLGPSSTTHQNHTGNGTYAHAVSAAKELVKVWRRNLSRFRM